MQLCTNKYIEKKDSPKRMSISTNLKWSSKAMLLPILLNGKTGLSTCSKGKFKLLDSRLISECDMEGLHVHFSAVLRPNGYVRLMSLTGIVLLRNNFVAVFNYFLGWLLIQCDSRAFRFNSLKRTRFRTFGGTTSFRSVFFVASRWASMKTRFFARRISAKTWTFDRFRACTQSGCWEKYFQ